MPISREAFLVGNPTDKDDSGEGSADLLNTEIATDTVDASGIFDSDITEPVESSKNKSASGSAIDESAQERLEGVHKKVLISLPSADTTSAEKREAVGAAHPQREARRSVASGRDVPQFISRSQERERMQFNWDEAHAQSAVYEGRARMQRDATTEHLARIHDVVGLLIEMSEAHSNDARTKLQSLESKVAELETRFSVNRLSP
ncbi:MAG TPA: hypothetical protein VGO67_25285 [Verrucomicrobiae bacterium]|jgi:hypothetical protein